MKEEYIKYALETFKGRALELVLNQIELYYDNESIITKNRYFKGDSVLLKKGTFIHGIRGRLDNFDWTLKNGFVSTNFTGVKNNNKYFNNIGMWNIQEDILLKDYVYLYSGVTLGYTIGRGYGSILKTKLIPYHEFESAIEKISDDESIWMWNAEQTKEIRFLPSLASNKIQIAFILNMESEYAKKLKKADIFNKDMDYDVLKYFIADRILDNFINDERNSFTTDRESAIMFGLPPKLIEGVILGRLLENDNDAINYINSKLPDCYICNIDGLVLLGNKK